MYENDNYNAIFQDLSGAIEVNWERISTYLLLERPNVYQWLHSETGADKYNSGKRFWSHNVQFKYPSEHTVDGVRMDLEMHFNMDPYDPAGNVK